MQLVDRRAERRLAESEQVAGDLASGVLDQQVATNPTAPLTSVLLLCTKSSPMFFSV